MQDKLRWGFMGTGWIADTVATDFAHEHLPIQAVGSSSIAKAKNFADKHSIAKIHGSYAELAEDPEIDVVYVTLMNNAHLEGALLAINAGKHVLVEKPFTMTADQAEVLIAAARKQNVFVMEAMWSKFLPVRMALKTDLESGIIGKVNCITSQYNEDLRDKPRIWDPTLGGGALLDLGVYPLNFIIQLFGYPARVRATAILSTSGVDVTTNVTLEYQENRLASFTSSVTTAGPSVATILGDNGRIEFLGPIWGEAEYVVFNQDRDVVKHYKNSVKGSGRQIQALEVERCIQESLTESPTMTLDDSLQVMRILDEIRSQIGVGFPGE